MPKIRNQSAVYKLIALGTVFTSFLCSCQTYVSWYQERWYNTVKGNILLQCKLQADSVVTVFWRDSTIRDEKSYFNKRIFLLRRYQYRNLVFESYHAQKQEFELRREVCEDGSLAFEGIFVGGEPYGISTWWACDNQLRMQGVRYKGERVGEWVIREEDVPGTEIKDYGRFELITSMPVFAE